MDVFVPTQCVAWVASLGTLGTLLVFLSSSGCDGSVLAGQLEPKRAQKSVTEQTNFQEQQPQADLSLHHLSVRHRYRALADAVEGHAAKDPGMRGILKSAIPLLIPSQNPPKRLHWTQSRALQSPTEDHPHQAHDPAPPQGLHRIPTRVT